MRDEWQRTASLEALLANLHRDPRRRGPATPGDFDPFARRDARDDTTPMPADITVLRDVFCRST